MTAADVTLWAGVLIGVLGLGAFGLGARTARRHQEAAAELRAQIKAAAREEAKQVTDLLSSLDLVKHERDIALVQLDRAHEEVARLRRSSDARMNAAVSRMAGIIAHGIWPSGDPLAPPGGEPITPAAVIEAGQATLELVHQQRRREYEAAHPATAAPEVTA